MKTSNDNVLTKNIVIVLKTDKQLQALYMALKNAIEIQPLIVVHGSVQRLTETDIVDNIKEHIRLRVKQIKNSYKETV